MNTKRRLIRSPAPANTPIANTILNKGDGFAFSIKKTAIIAVRTLIETEIISTTVLTLLAIYGSKPSIQLSSGIEWIAHATFWRASDTIFRK